MQTKAIHRLDAYAIIEAYAIVQLSFCVRWGLRPDWDWEKLAMAKTSLNLSKEWEARVMGFAMAEAKEGIEKAVRKLPGQYHEPAFLACARIVALRGYEEDIARLVELKEMLQIDDYKADFMIDLAKNEAELVRIGRVL